ncbi:MAG: 4Fe-4S binding protein, partial [Acidobacteria bacterium]|nr:4Fe-4S binding protein [Acidobacteriota bacterium]
MRPGNWTRCTASLKGDEGITGSRGGVIRVFVNNQICLHCGTCVGSCPTQFVLPIKLEIQRRCL